MNIRIVLTIAAVSLMLAGPAHASRGDAAAESLSNNRATANADAFNKETRKLALTGDPNASFNKPFECPMAAQKTATIEPMKATGKGHTTGTSR